MDTMDAIRAMRKINGQICTPPHMSDIANELEIRGLIAFITWPSGHWKITEAGHEYIYEHDLDEAA